MGAEHVLLIGGTRFIGPHLVQALREGGYEPTILHRGEHAYPFADPPPVIQADRKVAGTLLDAAKSRDWSAVVDLTAFTAEHSQAAIEAFTDRCGVFVHVSTGSIYQVLKDYHNPYHEDDALLFADPAPYVEEPLDSPGMLYGINKRACEEALFAAYDDFGFPVTIVRPPIVSGPLDYTLRDYAHLLRIRDGGPLIAPAPSGSFRHVAVQDLAQLIVAMIDQWDASLGEAFNAGGASILSLTEYYQLLARMLELPPPTIVTASPDVIEAEVGFASQPFGYGRNAVPDIAKAQSVLGWQPRRAEEYLMEMVGYFEGEYGGPEPESYTGHREKEKGLAERLMAVV